MTISFEENLEVVMSKSLMCFKVETGVDDQVGLVGIYKEENYLFGIVFSISRRSVIFNAKLKPWPINVSLLAASLRRYGTISKENLNTMREELTKYNVTEDFPAFENAF